MQPTLLILAAGMGSRYGGVKQLDQFGPHGETIIDYSLFDAIRAGFGKVVFIVREELSADFEEIFAGKLAGKLTVDFAIQALDSYVPEGRRGKAHETLGNRTRYAVRPNTTRIRRLRSSTPTIFTGLKRLN